jgi:hypothetical protein
VIRIGLLSGRFDEEVTGHAPYFQDLGVLCPALEVALHHSPAGLVRLGSSEERARGTGRFSEKRIEIKRRSSAWGKGSGHHRLSAISSRMIHLNVILA